MENLAQHNRFSDYLFWDVNQNKMSSDTYRDFVIRRVFELGTLDDLIESLAYYGRDAVKETLTSADSLTDNALDLATALFQLRPTDFRCYTSKPFPIAYKH
ncbi:hypothetical protein GO730_35820 [Spirosoma sp. HMF3257]|uniref:DUF6922 domain-containing protein n=1 Tax=Spirosoma telluris TaxID=2183553 RepID=A0A327NU63_9BACT|nr:hypothetical protein [Spirosoma telluris]RAI78113.1 hypothetical protein HMF3257_35735 [Spirosoma telluris]